MGRSGPGVRALVLSALAVAAALIYAVIRGRAPEDAPLAPFVASYCTDCHNKIDFDGGLAFDATDHGDVLPVSSDAAFAGSSDGSPADRERADRAQADRESAVWERAVRKVRAGLMPPADAARPSAAEMAAFVGTVERRLDEAWAVYPDPGAEPLSRLNRTEYANAIRDLLDFDAAHIVDTLPRDEVVGGFDNIGDALSVSPTLIESYVSAAIAISREAVGNRLATATQQRYEAASGLSQDRHVDGLPIGTRGGLSITHRFPLDAEYEFRVAGQGAFGVAQQSFCPPPDIVVAIDGELLEVADPGSFRLRIPAGPHDVAAALIDRARCTGVNDLFDVYATGGAIRHIEIHGPFDPTGIGDTPSRRAIFSCMPGASRGVRQGVREDARADVREDARDAERLCAEQILTRLATRAYRRPLPAGDPAIETLLGFYATGREAGDFESGIQQALARMLMSPQFIFQFEHEPEDLAPGTPYALSELELATRLAFFLWSSLPDDTLLQAAADGRLSDPVELEAQMRRMLADDRADALINNFAAQWLSLTELREALPQDREFDANLRQALESETMLLVSTVIESGGSLLELLDSDFTFLNERLADHYGIAGVRGSHMRPVPLDADHPRRGLLGHASWLTATSVADRTSPVIRGEWYITHLLGAPVPEPPPGVEADLSDEADIAREGDTLRQRLERHRANPVCASCHQIMDPIGLALENFDLVGRWRETDNGRPIDTSTVMTDGTAIDGVAGLRRYLQQRPELFVTAFTEKLLTYALGRVVDHRDMPTVREIVRQAEADGYTFESIVLGIVRSAPFRMRTVSATATATVAAAFATEPGPSFSGPGLQRPKPDLRLSELGGQ